MLISKKTTLLLGIVIVGSMLFLIGCAQKNIEPPPPTNTPGPTSTPLPPRFNFNSPIPNQNITIGDNEFIIINGAYQNMPDNYYVWILLEDIFGNYFIQNQNVTFNSDGTWEASNVRPLDKIRYVVAAFVNEDGNKKILSLVKAGGFGAVEESWLKNEVGGYKEIARVTIVTPGITLPPEVPTSQSHTNAYLDNFTTANAQIPACKPFGDELVEKQLVYCVYYINSSPELSYTTVNETQNALRVEYDFLSHPISGWDNWFSIRKDFSSPKNLSSFRGVRLNVFVEQASTYTNLRLSLADTKENNDEVWWCNTRNNISNPAGGWYQIDCPFDEFVLANIGRDNDMRFDRENIIAFEITVISDAGFQPSGVFMISSIEAYSDDN